MSNVEPLNSFEKIGDAANRVVENIRPFPSCPYDGSKISTPGIYDAVPMAAYHGDLCDGPSVSSSGLRLIEAKTPAHYYATSYLNPNRIEQDEKDAFDFGRAAHSLLLGESGFFKQFTVRPEAFKDYRTKAAQEWRDSTRAEGLTPLTSDDLAAIKAIAANLDAHPLARDLLRGHIEQSLVFKDGPTGVWLKSRPDVLPIADGVVADLKTTTDASPEAVQRTIMNFGYAMQGALIGKAMKAVLDIDMTAFALVFVEKAAPFAVNVVEVDLDWIAYAGRQLRRAIDTFARCVETDTWPGYEGEPVVYMPDWLRKRLDMEMDTGLLPREDAA